MDRVSGKLEQTRLAEVDVRTTRRAPTPDAPTHSPSHPPPLYLGNEPRQCLVLRYIGCAAHITVSQGAFGLFILGDKVNLKAGACFAVVIHVSIEKNLNFISRVVVMIAYSHWTRFHPATHTHDHWRCLSVTYRAGSDPAAQDKKTEPAPPNHSSRIIRLQARTCDNNQSQSVAVEQAQSALPERAIA